MGGVSGGGKALRIVTEAPAADLDGLCVRCHRAMIPHKGKRCRSCRKTAEMFARRRAEVAALAAAAGSP